MHQCAADFLSAEPCACPAGKMPAARSGVWKGAGRNGLSRSPTSESTPAPGVAGRVLASSILGRGRDQGPNHIPAPWSLSHGRRKQPLQRERSPISAESSRPESKKNRARERRYVNICPVPCGALVGCYQFPPARANYARWRWRRAVLARGAEGFARNWGFWRMAQDLQRLPSVKLAEPMMFGPGGFVTNDRTTKQITKQRRV